MHERLQTCVRHTHLAYIHTTVVLTWKLWSSGEIGLQRKLNLRETRNEEHKENTRK